MKWVTLCIQSDFTRLNFLQTFFCTIEGEYHHVFVCTNFITCCFDCINCTKCFVIVLTVYNIDVFFVLLQEGLHNFLAFCLCKFTGCFVKKVPAICSYSIIQTFGTANLCRCTDCTLNINQFHIFHVLCFHVSIQISCCLFTFQFEVRTYPCSIQTVIFNIYHTVNNDNRDSCLFCLTKNGIPSSLSNRCKYDVINILLDKVTDG